MRGRWPPWKQQGRGRQSCVADAWKQATARSCGSIMTRLQGRHAAVSTRPAPGACHRLRTNEGVRRKVEIFWEPNEERVEQEGSGLLTSQHDCSSKVTPHTQAGGQRSSLPVGRYRLTADEGRK